MASLYKKVISGKPYWYLREMGWPDGKPKLASERYLGTAAEIEALLDAREAAVLPERTRHLAFGDVAAAWGMLQELGIAGIIDEAARSRRADAGASAGTYLVLATLNRLVAPCSKLAFADWWKTTAADRLTKIPARVLDHRRFWDRDARRHPRSAGGGQPPDRGADRGGVGGGRVERGAGHDELRHVHRRRQRQGPGRPARQGQAEARRPAADRAGAGRDPGGRDPATWHAYPGDRPDVTQFPAMLDQLKTQYEAVCAAAGADADAADVTVVFDAGQNSEANFAHLAAAGLGWIGRSRPRTARTCAPCPPHAAPSWTRTGSAG